VAAKEHIAEIAEILTADNTDNADFDQAAAERTGRSSKNGGGKMGNSEERKFAGAEYCAVTAGLDSAF
jgi:hypothetical protein